MVSSVTTLETLILRGCVSDEQFTRTALPFLKPEYFSSVGERSLFELIVQFINKYNKNPSVEALKVEADVSTLPEHIHAAALQALGSITESTEHINVDWLIDRTETFCKERAIHNAILTSISIIDGEHKTLDKGAIPTLLADALGVSFDTRVGHDYFADAEKRYEAYQLVEQKLPFDIEMLNKITRGGVPAKTLNCIVGGTGVGKTLVLCHLAAANLSMGKNVLYISMEMSEERISERIDANQLNVPLGDIQAMGKEAFTRKVDRLRQKTSGELIVKEFPTAAAGANHFRFLLNELRLKKNFVPDVIYIDYLNICCSSRVRLGGTVNSYSYIKSIAEELRGLAVEFKVPIWTATQTNRTGQSDSDLDFEGISESHGLSMTLDMLLAISTNEELAALNQLLFKQLKNRYSDVNDNKRFVVGVDRPYMRLYDVEESAQHGIVGGPEDKPLMDNTHFGERAQEDDNMKFVTKRAGRKDFSKLVTL